MFRFEVLVTVKMPFVVFWVVAPYISSLVHGQTSSVLKMEAICSSETSVSTYKSTSCHNPEDQNQQCSFNYRCTVNPG
jgi:hypothetical protein